ncbi:hypothetical protein AGMMS50289_21910 [Betaproteobacteria bacterium]|nr:hypothetical protein AGMMS50289_21910 [Betaproteobacteria bacterium]
MNNLTFRFSATVLGLLAFTSCVAASPGSVAPVSRVVLFPDSALIERSASVRAGAVKLDISELPVNFDTNSVQIEADDGIEIGEIIWQDRAHIASFDAAKARLEKQIGLLTDRVSLLELERKTAEREMQYLTAAVSPGSIHQAGTERAQEVIQRSNLRVQQRILVIDSQKRDVERELEAKQNDLKRIHQTVAQVRSLSVRLQAKNDGQVHIRYLFQDAGWRPVYRALLDSEGSQMRLERIAQISQNSGEDWMHINLLLSTGQPWWNANSPEFIAETGQATETDKDKPDPSFSFIILDKSATEYLLPGVLTLPANRRQAAIFLEHLQVPVTLEAQISPRQEKTAYLLARGKLPEGVWPEGEIQLYRDRVYVGTTNWSAVSNRYFELSFGQDELIQVNSQSIANQNDSREMLKAARRVADVFSITNQHKRQVEILVLDASPIGRDDAVEVERHFMPDISQDNWGGHTGLVAWRRPINAETSQEFFADYRISWPKDRSIIGLP